MNAMASLVPMWIPTLIYGLGTALMLLVTMRHWRTNDREYQRGYDSGVADTIRRRISFDIVPSQKLDATLDTVTTLTRERIH